MADYKIYDVSNGAQVIAVSADRFKTNEISISFYNAAHAAECCRKCRGSVHPCQNLRAVSVYPCVKPQTGFALRRADRACCSENGGDTAA